MCQFLYWFILETSSIENSKLQNFNYATQTSRLGANYYLECRATSHCNAFHAIQYWVPRQWSQLCLPRNVSGKRCDCVLFFNRCESVLLLFSLDCENNLRSRVCQFHKKIIQLVKVTQLLS